MLIKYPKISCAVIPKFMKKKIHIRIINTLLEDRIRCDCLITNMKSDLWKRGVSRVDLPARYLSLHFRRSFKF